jgi:hypothetical protein
MTEQIDRTMVRNPTDYISTQLATKQPSPMITSKQIIEAYFGYVKPEWSEYPKPIFINPSSSDIKELKGHVKFVADAKERAVFVWTVNGPLHNEVISQLNLTSPVEKHILLGYANQKGYYFLIFFEELMTSYDSRDLRNRLRQHDWTWMERYHFDMKQFDSDIKINLPGISIDKKD